MILDVQSFVSMGWKLRLFGRKMENNMMASYVLQSLANDVRLFRNFSVELVSYPVPCYVITCLYPPYNGDYLHIEAGKLKYPKRIERIHDFYTRNTFRVIPVNPFYISSRKMDNEIDKVIEKVGGYDRVMGDFIEWSYM